MPFHFWNISKWQNISQAESPWFEALPHWWMHLALIVSCGFLFLISEQSILDQGNAPKPILQRLILEFKPTNMTLMEVVKALQKPATGFILFSIAAYFSTQSLLSWQKEYIVSSGTWLQQAYHIKKTNTDPHFSVISNWLWKIQSIPFDFGLHHDRWEMASAEQSFQPGSGGSPSQSENRQSEQLSGWRIHRVNLQRLGGISFFTVSYSLKESW